MHFTRTSLALLIGALVLALPAQASRQEVEPTSQLARWTGEVRASERAAAEVLRASRRARDDAERSKLGQRLSAIAGEDPSALIEILVRARVPETSEKDEPQILSKPQRAMVLAALGALPADRVRALLKERIESSDGDATKLAAVHVLGVVGRQADLIEACKLVPRQADGQLTSSGSDALRTAIASILRRDGFAWKAIGEPIRSQRPDVQAVLLDAIAETGDARGFDILFNVARTHRHLEQQAVSLLRSVAEEIGAEPRRECAAWLATQVRHARAEYARTLIQAIGVLDDGAQIPQLLEHLGDENPNTRETAAWALRKITGASYPTDSGLWKQWYAEEQRWMLRERPKLCDSLCSSDRSTVSGALRHYSERRTFRDELAIDLLPLLKRPEEDLVIRTCEVLARLRSPVAIESMLPLIDSVNPRIVAAAKSALEKIAGRTLPASSEDAYAVLHPD